MTRCKNVLEIINKNAGKDYQSPIKLGKTPIANEMAKLYSECKQGEQEFTEIIEEIAMKRGMISSVHKKCFGWYKTKNKVILLGRTTDGEILRESGKYFDIC